MLSSGYDMTDKRQITTATVACIRPAKDQVSQHYSLDWGEVPKVPPLAEDLLAVDID